MATQGTEKHYRIIVLLSKCGGITTRRLLCKHVADSRPSGHQPFPWTIDNFLSHTQQRILFFPNGKERYVLDKHKRLLFPTDGRLPATQPTDIEEWDLLLLCNVLTDACDQSPTTKLDLKILKRIRNKICHTKDASLSDDKYDEYAENIEVILDRFLALINDDDLTDEVHKQIKEVKDGALTRLESSIQTLDEWQKNEKDVSRQLTRLEDNVEVQLKDVREIKEQMQLLMTHFSIKKVPNTKLTMVVKNCNTEQEETVCRRLIALVNPTLPPLEEETKDSIRSAMKKAMKKLLSEDIELQTVEEECIAFYLKCPSVERLLDLWMKCTSGKLTDAFLPVEKCVRSSEGFENIQLQVILTENEFLRCLNIIVAEIRQNIGSTKVQASLVDRSHAVPGTAIEVNITPSSINHCKRILTTFELGSFTADLQEVALACEEDYGIKDVVIDAQLEIEQSIRNIVVPLPRLIAAKDIITPAEEEPNVLSYTQESHDDKTKTSYLKVAKRFFKWKNKSGGKSRSVTNKKSDKTFRLSILKNVSIRKTLFKPRHQSKRSMKFWRHRLCSFGLEKEFMAFFLYANTDAEFAFEDYEHVYSAFNGYFCESLRVNRDLVCDNNRHFIPGKPMADQILHYMELSHVVILMMTESFIQSHWSRIEAEAAVEQNKPIIVIVPENDIKSDSMDYVMNYVIETGHLVRLKIEEGVYSFSPELDSVCDAIITYVSKCQFDTTSTKPPKLK